MDKAPFGELCGIGYMAAPNAVMSKGAPRHKTENEVQNAR